MGSGAGSDCLPRRRRIIMTKIEPGRPCSGGWARYGGWLMTGSPELRPLGETLGTEALGIDLSRPLDDAIFAWIERAFAEQPVLVFRNQNLGPAELAAFGRRFGGPRIHSLVKYRHSEYPEVSWLTNVDADGKVDWFGVKR